MVPLRRLRKVVARVPEVLREGPGQVLLAVEDARVDLVDVDRDAGALGLLGEDLGGGHGGAAHRIGGRQGHRQVVVVAGRLEQRLGLRQILMALGQLVGVPASKGAYMSLPTQP